MTRWRFISIAASHYCEKARWALDYVGADYVEDAHLPMLHWRSTFRVGGHRTAPVLVAGSDVLADSTDILRFVDARAPAGRKLYPSDPALASETLRWEELFDDQLGPPVRVWAYFHLMPVYDLLGPMFAYRTPKWEVQAFKVLHPVCFPMMRAAMGIHRAGLQKARMQIDAVLDKVENRLKNGREYLVGDRFTAADLTFASLAAIVGWEPLYGCPSPPREQLPDAMRAQIEAYEKRPAIQCMHWLYARHRVEKAQSRAA